MGSFKCNLCNRPMPPHIYKFHLKKSHTEEEVQGQLEKNEEEIKTHLQNVANQIEPESGGIHDSPKKDFDWGEVYPCSACGEEYPAKAMPFHSWVKHRV